MLAVTALGYILVTESSGISSNTFMQCISEATEFGVK